MKNLFITIVLIFWIIFTLILAVSLIGIIVLIREDHNTKNFLGTEGDSNWFKIGKMLTKKLIE